jgi:hypothetical protein
LPESVKKVVYEKNAESTFRETAILSGQCMANKKLGSSLASTLVASFCLSGCGTHLPDMTVSADPKATTNKLLDVITHIKAELECAIVRLHDDDPKLAWLATGVGKATITLTADEKSIFNPTAIYLQNFPTASQTFLNKSVVTTPRNFGLSGGANVSSDATRVIQVDYSFDFARDFFADPKLKAPEEKVALCSPYGGLFIDGDLKVYDSFAAILFPYTDSSENKNDVKNFVSGTSSTMQTHITFIVAGTGSITPAWRLVPVSYNVTSNPFFQAGRTSTDDVIITIGKKPQEVAAAHDITKIGIQNNIIITNQ